MIRVPVVIALFTIAYAALVLALGIIPVNLLLRRLMGAAGMPALWRSSAVQLAERTACAMLICWITLIITGRARGRLTGSGMLVLGAAMSGALAGAVDVGLHRLWVTRLVNAAHSSPLLGVAVSLAITAVVVLVVTLLLIVRSMRAQHESAAAER
jgi:hypothetical protein